MTASIPENLKAYPWYAKHQAWLRAERGFCRHDPGDAAPERADLIGADLSRANLSRADLSGAVLSRADLSGADLSGAKGICSAGPVGAEGRIIYGVRHESGVMFQAGCFWGTAGRLRRAIKAKYKMGSDARLRKSYLTAVTFTVRALEVEGSRDDVPTGVPLEGAG